MTKPSWPKVNITTIEGKRVSALSPLIISASRSTDIPALFGDWLIKQFEQGYTTWKNPFNGTVQYISLMNTQIIAFWTKNPQPFMPYLDYFINKKIGFFFHYTLNDYEAEGFEPGIPALTKRIETFKILATILGRDKLLWRFDPIIITPTLKATSILQRIENIGSAIAPYSNRCTISFLTHYKKVVRRLNKKGVFPIERSDTLTQTIGRKLHDLSTAWNIPIYTCAESADMTAFNIKAGSCIDPQYILDTFDNNQTNSFIVNQNPNTLFPSNKTMVQQLKDPGQRPLCNCMLSKDIGTYNTCTLGCMYCYA
jgi:DNA repair photolyase